MIGKNLDGFVGIAACQSGLGLDDGSAGLRRVSCRRGRILIRAESEREAK